MLNTAISTERAAGDSPFILANDTAYHAWRERKQSAIADSVQPVTIGDASRLSAEERQSITRCCEIRNLTLYACAAPVHKKSLRELARQLGLRRSDHNLCADGDAVSSVQVNHDALRKRYIPYTDKALNWHTDGYYNPLGKTIRSFILHCVRDAARGGENAFLDPEMVYLELRDSNPEHILALMRKDAMTIPANTLEPDAARPLQSGPVFAVDAETGALMMRYTARLRSVVWHKDPRVRRARDALLEVIRDSRHIVRARLAPGQGVVCNNVLHSRSAFYDNPRQPRLVYRARYYDPVAAIRND